jgi:glycosyltransferase involved in cell wall biosynthesis
MDAQTEPLVSVVTPVYNGEEFLRECIESVLAQTYRNWEYTIVNNCSTDRTLEIAQEYAARDRRIRVHSNEHFAHIIQNHNIALRLISPRSRYCKVIFADDWLFPQCLAEMVEIAETYRSVGIVGAYGLEGTEVVWAGLPYPSTFIPGHKICHDTLVGGPYVFGTPASLLMRSDLIRARESFYNESNLHADHEACYELLRDSDFGFAHQVLTFSRLRPNSNSVAASRLESYILGSVSALVTYGPIYLTHEEYELRLEQRMTQYYHILAKNVLRMREKAFWDYHRDRLANLGQPLNQTRLAKAVLREVLGSFSRPFGVLDGVRTWWPRRFSQMLNK